MYIDCMSILKKRTLVASAMFMVLFASFAYATPKIPLGEEVRGIKLSGHLAGRKVYKLGADINAPGCWQDSVQWTGEALYFGISSINFSELASGNGFKYKAECRLPSVQEDGRFDIYKATLENGRWKLSNQIKLNSVESDAAIGVDGANIAFIRFFSPPKSFDIYLSKKDERGAWTPPYPYSYNSKCKEDNPILFDNGRKIIFESNRANPLGSRCERSSESMSLWFSKISENGHWSEPTLLKGDPNKGEKNTQPWMDENSGYLYWTADKEGNAIKRVLFHESHAMTGSEVVLSPNLLGLVNGSADGQIVFIGEYSEVNDYVFIACAEASRGGNFMKRWEIDIDICVIPPNQ